MGWLSNLFGGGGETYESKRRTSKSAHEIFAKTGSAYTSNREQISSQFTSNVGSAKARMGASGVSVAEGPAWQRILGDLATGRDEALAKVQKEEDTFKASTSYQLVKQDFANMGSLVANRKSRPRDGGQSKGNETYYDYEYAYESALTGQSFLNDEQKGMIKDSGLSGRRDYADSIKPTWEEYEKFRFGSDEDKAAFSDSMTSRIEASNTKYEKTQKADKARRSIYNASVSKMYKRDQNRK